MRKLSIIVFMVFSLLLSGTTLAMKMDITAVGDPVVGIPDNGRWPGGEAPPLVIDDNVNTKYLHFFDAPFIITGFSVTPKYNGMVVDEITFTTANDAPERDPVSFELYGSNDSINGPWTLIYSGDVVDFGLPDQWPRFTKNETPITFDNDVVYAHYQVLITATRVPDNGCCMQVAEVELLTTLPPIPAGWAYKDIGTTGGAAWEDPTDTINIRADGHDIWGNDDGMGFLYRPLEGDGVLQLNLVTMENWNESGWSKAGPAIRETTEPGSKHAVMAMTGTNGLQFIWRSATNGPSDGTVRGGETWPELMRIKREGDILTGEFGWKWDPVLPPLWTPVDSKSIPMNTDVYIGMVVSACRTGYLNHSVFDQITLTAPPYCKPWDMEPKDGSEGVSVMPTLTWRAGDGADEHQVLFGTDPDALPIIATKGLGDESYTPDTPLEENTTYYWRIVEQPGNCASPVMSFKTLYVLPWWTGSIRRELWDNSPSDYLLRGTDSYRYLQPPTYTDERTIATSPDIGWEYYIGRLTGHLIPSRSGNYTFWVAADDGSEILFNTDNAVCDPKRIAYWDWYSGNYDAHPEQMSATIHLEAGQKYLIQVVWKEGTGGDWVNVAWEGPDAPSRTEIIGQHLTTAFAVNPKPGIRATVTPAEAETLSWSPGKYATQQEVLFGTDPGAMASIATLPADPAVLDERTTLPAPPVAAGTTYYWQVNCTDGTDVWEGDVWSFTVSEWISCDLGRHDPAGSHSYDPVTGVHVINADGGDIWSDWDEFHFYYSTPKFTHDQGTIIARVLSLQESNEWAKAGVMIRQSLSANSKTTNMLTTPESSAGGGRQRATFQWRDCDGCGSGSSHHDGVVNPEWVKLVRNGNLFSGFHSDDGINWCYHGDRYVEMSSDIYVGLAVTSHSGGVMTTALIDNLSITTPDPRQSWSPSPHDQEVGVNIHAILQWGAGEGANQHLVYFSEDEDAVVNREALVATLPADVTEFNPFPSDRQTLDLGKTYYWAVDEQYNPVFPGEVWSFTVEEYRLLEDFESYAIAPEPLPEQQFIPGDVLVEAVPPPDQAWVDPVTLADAIDPGTDCLVSRWDFEGDYTDSAGSNDGTAQGDATIVTDAERGNVLSLDGDGDYVDCGNPADLNFTTNDWTISLWINTTVTGKPQSVPYGNGGDGSGGIRYTVGVGESNSDKMTLTCDDDGKAPGSTYGKKQTHATTPVTDGVWHHVMAVREGELIRIYTDAQLEDEDSLGGADFDLTGVDQHEVLIGAIYNHNKGDSYIQKFYTGLIDDVRVYNCALSAENARFLAEVGPLVKPGYYGPCIAHYDFDEGSGSTAIDSSGNGLDGVISGAEYTATTADGSASCLDFGGDGDNVLNSDAGPYLNNLGAMSISMWVQSDLIDTDKGFFMGGDTASDRWGMRYDAAGGDGGGDDVIKYGVMTTGGNEEDESSALLQTTDWQHLVMSWQSGAGIKLYVNGVLNIPTSDKGPVTGVLNGYTKILVGKGSKDGDADAGWDGRIDDVRVYDYALSEGEARYLAGVGNKTLPDRYVPMLLHLEFEGNLEDSSGNEKHGTAIGEGIGFEDDPEKGQVLSLPGGDNIYVQIPPVDNSGNMPVSIACWAKADHTSIPDWTLVFGFTTPGGDCGSHFNIGSIGGPGGVGAHVWCWEATIFTDEQALDWHHYTMTFDGGTVRYYGDGIQIGEVGQDLTRRGDYVNIGKRNTQASSFPGKVDDARIYDYPLNLGQIRMLAQYYPPNMITDVWSGRASAIPVMEWKLPAHGGAQSMRVEYTGSGAVTRLDPFGDGAHPHGWNGDWTLGQAKALSMWFKGDPGNAPGQMFAQVTTGVSSGNTQRVIYDGDPQDLLIPGWQPWDISLQALGTGKPDDPPIEEGLPLTKIKEFGVGIIGAGGGVLYFDDMRLYPTRCVPKYTTAYDLTDDCVVDREDLGVIANAWLAQEGGNGLWYEYYQGDWDVLPYFPGLPLTTQGAVDNFDIGVRLQNDYFGFRFTGIVAAPVPGDYTFYLNSDDGSKLYIDDGLVVDYDGLHGMGGPIEGTINLTAGEHLIEVIQFEKGGGEGLTVEVAGPGIPRIPIPNDVLFLAPGIPADFNGDGIVNFKDYADLLNHLGEEVLFPSE